VLNRRIELTALRRDGTEFPIELAITPLQSGVTFTFAGFIRDISERKTAEAKLAKTHQELLESSRLAGMAEGRRSVV